MISMDNLNLTVKQKQFDELSAPLVLDLVALFNLMREDIEMLVRKAEKEGWSPEKLIKEIGDVV